MGTWPGLSMTFSPSVIEGASARETSTSFTSTIASGVRAIRSLYATVPVTVAVEELVGSVGDEATFTRTMSTLVGLPRVMTLYRVSLMNASLPSSVILAWIA